jgi:hypothetical protein
VAPTTSVPPAPAAPQAPSAEALAAAREAAISDVLSRYKAGLESRNLEAIKKIWPGLSGAQEDALRTQFRTASSINVGIIDPRISATNETATVTFVRDYVVMADGQRFHSQSDATMTLRRAGSAWVIERISFVPRR